MSTFPGSPRLLKGGIVVVDPVTAAVLRVINLQYNPDTLTRSLQIKGVGAETGDRIEALRLKGPPVETIKVEAEIDACNAGRPRGARNDAQGQDHASDHWNLYGYSCGISAVFVLCA